MHNKRIIRPLVGRSRRLIIFFGPIAASGELQEQPVNTTDYLCDNHGFYYVSQPERPQGLPRSPCASGVPLRTA